MKTVRLTMAQAFGQVAGRRAHRDRGTDAALDPSMIVNREVL
jgi:hypothetical protein